jgi:GAF domain-containing protein
MLNRGHRLKVGEVGIVGYVTGTGKPRIATDVGIDAVYFQNPDLPLTRSEMTLPLIIGDRIIGALDVQSTEANIFSQEDVELFTILADQVAIAIENNVLLQETVRALEASESLHRQYLLQEWGREVDERDLAGFEYTPEGVKTIDREDSLAFQKVFEAGEPVLIPVIDQPSGKSGVSLAVPISLRGETIGVINIEETRKEKKDWQKEEIQAVQSVANQVALALENARLFEQTLRRAERDRKVLEITGKIRSTTNPQEMVQIAIEELQNVLKATRAQILIQETNPAQENPPDTNISDVKQ